MSLVPLQHRVRAAFGADLSQSPLQQTWTDISAGGRLLRPPIPAPGAGDRARRLQPSTSRFRFLNDDGALTPGNPSSVWAPNVKRSTPLWWETAVGVPHVMLTGAAGSRARTPDNAALDIVGDWFTGVEIEPPLTKPPAGFIYEVGGKFVVAGGQQSIVFFINEAGLLGFRYSTTGVNAFDRFSTEPLTEYLWDTLAWAYHLDVNNGAAGNTTRFYMGRTLDAILADPAAHLLGDPVVSPGVTTVFSSTAPLDVGDVAGSGFQPFPGKLRRFLVRAGAATGAVAADLNPTVLAAGATGQTDSAGRVWTFPALENWKSQMLGEIVAIEPEWTHGDPGLPTVDITATTVAGKFTRRRTAIASPLTRKITAPAYASLIDAHWPWEDGSQATHAASTIPGIPPMLVVGFRFGADQTLPATASMATLSGGQPGGWNGSVPDSTPGNWSVNWLVNIPTLTATDVPLQVVTGTGTARTWLIQADNVGYIFGATDAGGGAVVATVAGAWGTFAWQYPSLLRLHEEQNGGNVDWSFEWIALQGPSAGISYSSSGSYAGTCGRVTKLANLLTAPPDGMSVGQMSVTTGTPNNFLSPADSAYVGETAAARFKRICEEERIPVIVEGDPANSPRMGPQPIATIPEVLDECARTDGGMYVEQRYAPGLGLRTLRSMFNQAPRATYDIGRLDGGGQPAGDLDLPFSPVHDDRDFANKITASRANGSSVVVTTTPAPQDEETYPATVDANVESDLALVDPANWALHAGTTEQMRYREVRYDLIDRAHQIEDHLHTGPGDTFAIQSIPQHDVDDVALLLESRGQTIGTDTWDVDLSSSPGVVLEVGVRDDPNRGKRDSSTSTLSADFDAGTDTSFTVAVGSGLLWSTAGGDVPIQFNIGGARVNVTAIAGASSPQTFTCDAATLNGVTRTMPAGTQVRLWRPTVRAR